MNGRTCSSVLENGMRRLFAAVALLLGLCTAAVGQTATSVATPDPTVCAATTEAENVAVARA
jgi:hypothetical protein